MDNCQSSSSPMAPLPSQEKLAAAAAAGAAAAVAANAAALKRKMAAACDGNDKADAAGGSGVGEAASSKRTAQQSGFECPVPIRKPRTDLVSDGGLPAAPLLPMLPPNGASVDAWPVIKSVVPWVEATLVAHWPGAGERKAPEAAAPGEVLRRAAPLDIRSTGRESEMGSYQAPWDHAQCLAALRTTNMYQAGGNLFWVNFAPGALCPAPKISWAQVRELQASFFEAVGGKATLSKEGRLVFPATLQVYIQDFGIMNTAAGAGDTTLPLLGGHGLVMAWWAAMLDALRAGQAASGRVAVLWQCALTTTIQVRLEPEPSRIMALSVLASESLAQSAKHLTDNFLVFCEKLRATAIKVEAAQLDAFKQLGMRYNGAPVNKTMLQAAGLVLTRLSPQCLAVLSDIEFSQGREVLTGAYNKIMRVLQQVEKVGADLDGGVPAATLFFLQAMQREFRRDPKAARAFTLDSIPGQVATVLARKWVRDECDALASDLSKLEKRPSVCGEFERVLQWFADLDAFNEAFPLSAAGQAALPGEAGEVAGEAAEGDEQQEVGDDDEEPDALETKKATLSKHGGQLLELCYALYSGLGDKTLRDLVAKEGSLRRLPKLLEEGGGIIGEHFRALKAAMASHKKIIAVESSAAPPPATTRELKRWSSEASEGGGGTRAQLEADRQDCWRRAQQLRRKEASVFSWAYDTGSAGLDKILAKPGAVKDFTGKQKESHRAFVFSADLADEAAAEPWRELSDASADSPHAAAMLSWMLTQRGPFDILVFADGRSRRARRVIEEALKDRAHVVEFWVIFGGGSSRVCPGRDVTFGAANREVILVALPCPKTQLRVKKREAFKACGETSTHWTCYTNVPGLQLKQMAKVQPDDKRAFFQSPGELAKAPDSLADCLNDAVPLFWQERKSPKFWLQFFRDLDVRCVVDCTPGSGVLAAVCLQEGWPYCGIVRNAPQATFLQNRMDRDALSIIAKAGSALYEEDFAETVRKHFQDIVDQGTAAEEVVEESDADGGGEDE